MGFTSCHVFIFDQSVNHLLPAIVDLIDVQALSEAMYISSFYMGLLAAHVKSLQSIQLTM